MVDKQHTSPVQSEKESSLNDSPPQQEASAVNVVAKESLADWGVVVCVFLSNLIATIDLSGFAVFYPYLVEHFDATAAAVGWCSSAHGFFQSLAALFASYPIQFYGCRLPGVVGCLLFSLGVTLSCLAPSLTVIYFTYGIIAGSGSGLASISTNIIVHQRFTRNRNLASVIGSFGYSIGGMIGSILTNQLIQLYGWRGAFLILGAIQAQRIPLCLFFRTPKKLISQSKYVSGTSSPRLFGEVILSYLKEVFNFSILCKARYSVFSVSGFVHVFCMSGYWPHSVNRAIHVGLSRDQGVAAVALISITSLVTRVPVAFITNLKKVKSTLIFGTGMFFAFLSIVAIYIDPGIIGTMASTALFGMHMGCTVPMISVVTVDLMGVALLPKSYSMLQFTGGFAKLAASPLIGWVFDVTRDYNKAFAIIGCMAFVSSSLMFALTVVIRCQRKKSDARDMALSTSINVVANPPINNSSKQ